MFELEKGQRRRTPGTLQDLLCSANLQKKKENIIPGMIILSIYYFLSKLTLFSTQNFIKMLPCIAAFSEIFRRLSKILGPAIVESVAAIKKRP